MLEIINQNFQSSESSIWQGFLSETLREESRVNFLHFLKIKFLRLTTKQGQFVGNFSQRFVQSFLFLYEGFLRAEAATGGDL